MAARATGGRSGSVDKAAILRGQRVFADLSPAALDELCRYARAVSLRRGEPVFLKGDSGTAIFLVIGGTVRASATSSEGRTAVLNLIGPGELFGEIAVLDGLPRTADAFAHSDCQLLVIDRRDLFGLMQRQPELTMKFIELLCTRLRWISEHVELVMLQSMPARLASTILRLAERPDGASASPTIAMTQAQVSAMAGMSRESANKVLAAWAAEGWVGLEHGTLRVLQFEALRAVAGES